MNEAFALPQGLLESLKIARPAIVAFPTEQSAKQLPGTTVEAVRGVVAIMDQIISGAIEKRTAEDFKEARKESYPAYANVMLALGSLAGAVVPRALMNRLIGEAFCEMEADLREHGLSAFGAEVRDQAIFTVWTLRRTSEVCEKIHRANAAAAEDREADARFAEHYLTMAMWTRFHVDCLIKSMDSGRALYPGVLAEMIDGLRGAVDAYAWARRGLALRVRLVESAITPVEWDQEDEQLLSESTRDMASIA
jgi:hypothetical protein